MQAERSVNRGANPFAPMVEARNRALSSGNSKVSLLQRVEEAKADPEIIKAIELLRERLGGHKITQDMFGRVITVPRSLIDYNVDIQRELEKGHMSRNILAQFDPRIFQPIMCIYHKDTGRYSAWEGQQSSTCVALMIHFGLIDEDVEIQVKVVDDDLAVPGSPVIGEAVANLGFRLINGSGRKPVDAFHVHRSRVNGHRKYGSELIEDVQSHEIQSVLESANMFPAAAHEAAGRKALPGMVTHISAVNNVAGHGSDDKTFETNLEDLRWAMQWHDTYFSNEKGVDGGFILGFGRLHAASRGDPGSSGQSPLPAVPITPALEQELAVMVREKYLSPHGWHTNCKERLKKWQIQNNLAVSWRDDCLAPFLVMDYLAWGGTQSIPIPRGMNLYAGI